MKTITVDFSWFHVSKLHFKKFNFMTKMFSVVKKIKKMHSLLYKCLYILILMIRLKQNSPVANNLFLHFFLQNLVPIKHPICFDFFSQNSVANYLLILPNPLFRIIKLQFRNTLKCSNYMIIAFINVYLKASLMI